ncbi:MAG: SDR family oxidoreductase [Bacteroidetes bacterium]|nr:SDR family oxidoreductase [Bacteroidota bacterium]
MKAIIAGGSSGMGLATAALLAQEGKEVYITGRNPEKITKALAGLPQNVSGQAIDSNDRQQLDRFMAATGPIDHLVLALSGGKGLGMIKDLDLSVLREGFEEKFFPQLQTIQAALPYLKSGGSITIISAVSGHAHFPGIAGIGAINAALEAIVPILAKELAPVRVNAVSPGVVDTPWWNIFPEDVRRDSFTQYAAATPVGRIGQPEDIARFITLIINNSFITGQVITVDGGLGL